jgi:hypothetical protein
MIPPSRTKRTRRATATERAMDQMLLMVERRMGILKTKRMRRKMKTESMRRAKVRMTGTTIPETTTRMERANHPFLPHPWRSSAAQRVWEAPDATWG